MDGIEVYYLVDIKETSKELPKKLIKQQNLLVNHKKINLKII